MSVLEARGLTKRFPGVLALDAADLVLEPGTIHALLGENGAGKSTLLKILSRITDPTEGEAVINGRVGSLLEVGTGFHPELTGRESVAQFGIASPNRFPRPPIPSIQEPRTTQE